MGKITKFFTQDALAIKEIEETGDMMLISNKGRHVLTIVRPVQKSLQSDESYEADLIQYQADLRLHQNSLPLYEGVEVMNESLQLLKSGKLTIFDFPIDKMIQITSNLLNRASEIS